MRMINDHPYAANQDADNASHSIRTRTLTFASACAESKFMGGLTRNSQLRFIYRARGILKNAKALRMSA